ncbi:hypothetical protein ACFV1L_22025 [Kitasatospora sp. NPDC059646]
MSDLTDFLRFLTHAQDHPKDELLRVVLIYGFALIVLLALAFAIA